MIPIINDIVDLEDSFNETDFQSSHQTDTLTNIKKLSEELFAIKESLLVGAEIKVHKDTGSCLNKINGMLEEFPVLCENLYKWKFLTNEALHLLRSKFFDTTLLIITKIISRINILPSEYIKTKFIFFITEKLYNKLKLCGASIGISILERDILEDINIGTNRIDCVNSVIAHDTRVDENKPIKTTKNVRLNSSLNKFTENSLNRSIENIIIFIKQMIVANKDILYTLCENGALVLINSVISNATCQLYNEIFRDVYFYNKIYTVEKKNKGLNGLYEIQRKHFDPEVIFREKQVIELQHNNSAYKKGIYEKIYNECHVLRKLFEFNIGECLNLLLYKRTVFMNGDLDLLIREKNVKAIKAYRNGLECGRTPDQAYLFLLIQLLDEEKTKRDSCLSLYYFIELIDQNKHFTETRIRRIFECLEKECTLECELNCKEIEEYDKTEEDNIRSPIYYDTGIVNTTMENKIIPCSIADNNYRSGIVNNYSHYDHYDSLKSSEKGAFRASGIVDNNYMSQSNNDDNYVEQRNANICSYNSMESLNFCIINDAAVEKTGRNENSHLSDNKFDINLCDRLRIIKLIKHLYGLVEKRYFYKPSYLILMKFQMLHCSVERDFLNLYFHDFVWFVEHGKNNLARALFSDIKKIESRQRTQTNTARIDIDATDYYEPIDLGDCIKDNSEDEILIDRINRMKSASKM